MLQWICSRVAKFATCNSSLVTRLEISCNKSCEIIISESDLKHVETKWVEISERRNVFFFNMFSSVDVGGCYPLFRRTSIHFENPNMALTHLWVSGIQVISKSKGLATCTTITPTLCILAPERYNAWNNHLCILWSPSCCLITPTWHCSHVLQTLTDPAPESWRDSLFPQKTAYSQKKGDLLCAESTHDSAIN